MKEELKYAVQVAPAYATYLRTLSGSESARKTARACIEAECGEEVAREMIAVSMTSPDTLINSENPVKRAIGFAWNAVEAGSRDLGIIQLLSASQSAVSTFLTSTEQKFTSFFSMSATIFILPLLLTLLWALGFLPIESWLLSLTVLTAAAVNGVIIYRLAFRDVPWYELYTFAYGGSPLEKALFSSAALALAASAAAGALLYISGLPTPAALGLAAFTLWLHLRRSGRGLWLRHDQLVAFVSDVAGTFKSGIPIKAALPTIVARYPAARDLAYGARRPSFIYRAAYMLYKAVTDAGPLDVAIGVLRDFVAGVRRINALASNNALMIVGVVAAAALISSNLAAQYVALISQLGDVSLLVPPPVEDVKFVLTHVMSLAVAFQVVIAFLPRGMWLAAAAGAVAGTVYYMLVVQIVLAHFSALPVP